MSGGRWTVQEVAESKSMSNFHFHFYTTSNILCPLASMIVYGIPQKNLTRCITLAFSNMYGCESWTVKKVEHQRIDAFELWCWRKLSRVPWTTRRSNQFILNEISPEYSLEGLMLKPKLRYLGLLMGRTDSLEKTLMLGGTGGRRRRGRQDEMAGWHH